MQQSHKKEKKIVEWMVKNATNYQLGRRVHGYDVQSFSFTDINGYQQNKNIGYNHVLKKFQLLNTNSNFDDVFKKNDNDSQDYMLDVDDDYYISAPIPEPAPSSYPSGSKNKSISKPKSVEKIYFRKDADSNFYYGKNIIQKIPNATYDFIKNSQLNPIIYSLDHHYGIITSNIQNTKAIYDSLTYIKQWDYTKDKTKFPYLVGEKDDKNGTWKFGIIDQFGDEIIPIIYDTLFTYIPEIRYDYYRKGNETINFFKTEEPNTYSSKKKKIYKLNGPGWLLGIKNGKHSILDITNNIILSSKYDGIYKNGISYILPTKSYSDYYIIKKDKQFGFVHQLTDSSKFKKKIIFPKMPTFFLPDYWENDGFHLIGLADEDGIFCYAREDGFLYYREK